ncbi:hypothetical protein SAMN02745121_04738 [Nannocystis exedens]|uniref:Uncharacterized protein n=1 Tax=Nannocystis exedens TaxID=54 RepID=A0A1I2BKP2_9BACT|nr:hypothetical protein [Nannocystis exedens]PCC67919.1 hypothetical protein NAEX_00927 [Nannocystis exedens]SFE56772.1 hypothetical protein SAMN02745121_04738 [Nannocystis exedens]
MSDRSRPSRAGFVAFLGLLVALVAGYLNDCFAGLGLSPDAGQAVPAGEPAKPSAKPGDRVRVVVQGEQCRVGGDGPLRPCDAVCAEQAAGATVEIDATAGAQRAVDALRTCVQARGAKAQVVSE